MNTAPAQTGNLAITVNALDGDCLVLETATGDTFRWPRQNLPSKLSLKNPLTLELVECITTAGSAAPTASKSTPNLPSLSKSANITDRQKLLEQLIN